MKPSPLRTAKVAKVSESILDAYPEDSPYRVCPPDMESFNSLIAEAEDSLLHGVPDNTSANERSAMNKYWVPFCAELGMSPMRPSAATLTAAQSVVEDNLKALCIPWIYVRMRGKANPHPLPSSVMNVMYSINRVLNRDNDDDVKL